MPSNYSMYQLRLRGLVVFSIPQKDFINRECGYDLMDYLIEHHPSISSLPHVESFDRMGDTSAICMHANVREF